MQKSDSGWLPHGRDTQSEICNRPANVFPVRLAEIVRDPPHAMEQPAPMLHAGVRPPHAVLDELGRVLAESGMMSNEGYLAVL